MGIANGVWPVMITPFTEDNQIDYDAVLQMIDWYDHRGVSGIFAVCQSSEMFYLSARERLALTKFIVNHAPEHLGIIASGHVSDSIEEQMEEANAALDTGIQAYVFVSNRFAREDESEDVAKRNIERLLSGIGSDAFGIYECPYPYKRLISPELLQWCANTGKFSFLKDTSCNLEQMQAKREAVAGTNLKLFNANAATLLESLKFGYSGYSGVMANFHPQLYRWLCKNYAAEPEKAQTVQDLLGMASIIECQGYPVNAKYHMQLEGIQMSLLSRTMNIEVLTQSRRMEIEQFKRMMEASARYLQLSSEIMPEGIK